MMKKAKHIGIVGCSAEGAALCYRTICVQGADLMGEYSHPEVTMHTHSFGEYVKHIRAGNWDGVAGLMLSSAEKVAKAGADFIICPDNTIHQAFDLVAEKSPLPWLHIAEVVAAEAKRRNFKCVGVLGTRYLMEGPVYPAKLSALGIKHLIPEAEERKHINHIIFDELVNSRFTDESRAYLVKVINNLKGKGCDAMVLGCTEIPLLITEENSPLPTLDSTRLLAKAALMEATR
jgi:aspartate racemase